MSSSETTSTFKAVFSSDASKVSTWHGWALLAFVFFIPISSFVSARLLFATVFISFFAPGPKNVLITSYKRSWDVIVYCVVLLTGLLYTTDTQTGLKVLESNFSFIAIPIVYSKIGSLSERKLTQIILAFVYGLAIACGICLITALIKYQASKNFEVFFYNNLTDAINSHPTYLAYYLIFAITFILYQLFYNKFKRFSTPFIFLLLFLFSVLLLTGGHTVFISILLVFSFFMLKFLIEDKDVSKWKSFLLVCIMTISLFFAKFSQDADFNVLSDSWERLVLWESTLEATPDLIFGVGTGDYKIVIKDYYLTHDLVKFAGEIYNAHNQFIQILFSNGIPGLAALLILLARPLYLSTKHQYMLSVLVFFPFILHGMTEVFFGRFQGIVFFAFLHQTFIAHIYSMSLSLNKSQSSVTQQMQ